MKTIRAYYKRLEKSYWGHICHVDNGNGRPLCNDHNRRIGDASSVAPLWVHSVDANSCKYCANQLKKIAASEVEA